VVRRDLEIEAFVPKPFYEVLAHLQTEGNERFSAKWLPSEACLPWQDEEGGCSTGRWPPRWWSGSRETRPGGGGGGAGAQAGGAAPYNLSSLQIDAAKRFGMDAKRVLDICQSLYERHKLITYPRSDSRHLPSDHFNRAGQVREAIASTAPALAKAVSEADGKIRSKAWNDSKVDVHHAIIPTEKQGTRPRWGRRGEALRPDCPPVPAAVLPAVRVQRQQGVAAHRRRAVPGQGAAHPQGGLEGAARVEEDDEEEAGTLPALRGEELLCERGSCWRR
jgi:DNA topoisomerase-3